ncbi:signal peptide peptidase SppA [Xanthovirga aplysinae]|uniref:signal peptide peptidase SppA n=1 Tax=Xanthovirga aplysinae TaxID=2529853 RepID=UPI0012BBA4F9|nr:signal peptide peptidase SppA [Xanthovirga aplysinae]MTI30294.1 signal peptide peptidase SppA [Xanthovirga aplysinae]
MGRFFKIVLATIVGLIIFSGLTLVLLIIIISSASKEEEVKLKENTVLELKLDKQIVERTKDDPFGEFPYWADGDNKVGLIQLMEAIEHAKNDDKIEGIFLEPRSIQAGYSSLSEIRKSLQEFKSSGKFIYAYGETFSEADYFLASVADKVFLNPRGLLEFNGFKAENIFFKKTLEKLELEPQIFRVGDYKSAVEPFIREDMSEASRIQTTALINSLYNTYLKHVANSRQINNKELKNISENLLVRNAKDAKTYKLVDQLAYFDEVQDAIRQELELEQEEKIPTVTYKKYRKSYSNTKVSANRIAVIVASGNIVSGKGGENAIGSDTFAAAIRKARKDKKIKAIVLRVNSPGGSALASDVIWREVKLATKEKPVIASMSDYAASGGYYISMASDTIVAEPNTITGSIGIFGIIVNAKGLLNNKLGITTDVVKTGKYSDIMTATRPLSDFEKSVIQKSVEEGYEAFTTKAAEGRNMSLEKLKQVASGRVWSGEQALSNGLVDVLGGLEDAINIAAKKAGVEDDYKVRYYPKQKGVFEQIFEEFSTDLETRIRMEKYGEMAPYIQHLEEIKEMDGLQTRLPFDLIIQ